MTIDDQIACVRREVAMRERAYPKFVAAGRMTQDKANREIAAMRAVLSTLETRSPPPVQENIEGDPSPGPWNLMSSSAPTANGAFHLYLVDRSERKIAALWGSEKEKLANGVLICDARNGNGGTRTP